MTGKGEKKRRRALEAYDRLQRAAARTATAVDEALQAHALNASQFGVLAALAERGPTHQQELAESLGRSKAQMTAIIDGLEQRALVRRERQVDDKRYVSVHLTDAGGGLLAVAAPSRDAVIVQMTSALSGVQRGKLARLCRRLVRAMDTAEAPEHADDGQDEPDDAMHAAPADGARTSAGDADTPDGRADDHSPHDSHVRQTLPADSRADERP